MLKIPIPSYLIVNEYFSMIKDAVTTSVCSSSLNSSAKDFLSSKKIEEIITDSASKLLEHHNQIIPQLGQGFSIKEYEEYYKIKNKKKKNGVERSLFNKYHQKTAELFNVFDYDKLISHNQGNSYRLAEMLNRNTCTYCNRLYTIMIKKEKKYIARPQFDHWYAKKKYPVLALSFFNLIPSCSVCNSSIKGNKVFSIDKHLHPYLKENDESLRFTYSIKSLKDYEIVIESKGDKTIETVKDLELEAVYQAHSKYELKELLDLRQKYSKNYIKFLFDELKSTGVTEEEVYRLIFGIESKEEDFHKRPFSKFKHDIIEEIRRNI